jgi:hypothetical protein
MVRKTEVTLIDDLDGSKATETISFGLGNSRYSIDLSSKNAKKLRDTLTPYVAAARKTSTPQKPGRGRQPASSGPKTSAVREWAKTEGIQVSERGRISADVVVRFQEAH